MGMVAGVKRIVVVGVQVLHIYHNANFDFAL